MPDDPDNSYMHGRYNPWNQGSDNYTPGSYGWIGARDREESERRNSGSISFSSSSSSSNNADGFPAFVGLLLIVEWCLLHYFVLRPLFSAALSHVTTIQLDAT